MKRYLYILPIFLLLSVDIQAQEKTKTLKGLVTYTTAKNTYVRFGNTESIQIGDTLFIGGTPCLKVEQKSSSSCICVSIGNCKMEKDLEVVHKSREVIQKPELQNDAPLVVKEELPTDSKTPLPSEDNPVNKEYIRARISAASYSNLSSEENEDIHRTMLRFNLNALHINNSKYSFETYLNFRENFLERELPEDYQTRFFNVYNLALTYNLDSTSSISLGRKINRRMSSVGPIDGIQAEKQFGAFYTGGIIGFKPDLREFGFNYDLLEYGGFIGFNRIGKKIFTESTLGILEQKNAGVTDRRYAYVQHSSSINRKLSLFGSIELDLFEKINETSSVSPRLTNLFVSSRYRFSRRFSISLSYDSRKRIIYYETLRTEVEKILADDEARQGIRLRVNSQPFKYINTGISYGKRFQNNGQNKSENINIFLSHSRMPFLQGRLSFNFNENKSNYLKSRIYGIRHSRTLIRRKLEGIFYFRKVKYEYLNSEITNGQIYYGTNFSLRISKSLRFSLLGEWTKRESGQSNLRFNTKLIKRFNKKQR